jgi:2'-5' RNA ligase
VPRLRLGVALLLPEPLASEVDGLRRACDDGALGRVPPHLTLVPPVNVRVDDVPEALRVLREAAAAVRPFALRLGPPSTFLPDTPTLHLAVGGRGDATSVLRRLRDGVFRPPLERSLTFGFVPHVTLSDEMEPARIAASIAALSGFVVEVTFDRVHLLQEQRHGDAHRQWVPIADASFTPKVVVGRGGVELDLAVCRLLDPEAAAFETGSWPDDEPRVPPSDAPPGCEPIVVTARRRGEVAGVARGWADAERSDVCSLLVAPEQRGQGIARQLMAAFRHAAAQVGDRSARGV